MHINLIVFLVILIQSWNSEAGHFPEGTASPNSDSVNYTETIINELGAMQDLSNTDHCKAEGSKKTNKESKVILHSLNEMSKSIRHLELLKTTFAEHGFVAYAQSDDPDRVNKIKPSETTEDTKDKLKLDYKIDDSSHLLEGYEIFHNRMPTMPGHYNYVFTESGELVLGRVKNKFEFGVKHHQLARGQKVFSAGEAILRKEKNKFVLRFNDQSGTFSKPILASLKQTSEDNTQTSSIKDHVKYQQDVRSFTEKIFRSTLGADRIDNVSFTTDRLNDGLAHPSVEYLAELCSKTYFTEGRNRNSKFCKHVKETLKLDVTYTDPRELYGLLPIAEIGTKDAKKGSE